MSIDFIDSIPTPSSPVLCWGFQGINFMIHLPSLEAHEEAGESIALRRAPRSKRELAAIAAFLRVKGEACNAIIDRMMTVRDEPMLSPDEYPCVECWIVRPGDYGYDSDLCVERGGWRWYGEI